MEIPFSLCSSDQHTTSSLMCRSVLHLLSFVVTFVVLCSDRIAQHYSITVWPAILWPGQEAHCEQGSEFSFYSFPIAVLVLSRLTLKFGETRIKPYPGKHDILWHTVIPVFQWQNFLVPTANSCFGKNIIYICVSKSKGCIAAFSFFHHFPKVLPPPGQ